LSAETNVIRSAETVLAVEGNMRRSDLVRTGGLCGVQEPSHACKHDTGTWEVFEPSRVKTGLQRKGASSDTDDTRFEEVRLGHSSDEAGEQRGASLGGVGGAKGRAEGELDTPKQAPCTGMGSPVTCGGSGTASCYTSGLPSPSNGGAACLSGHVRICAGGAGQPAFLPQCAKGVDYVFGLAHNVRLTRRTVKHMERSRRRMIATGKPSRRFTGFRYRTLESWSRKRRVVAKAEWLAGESPRPSSRFIVTSLSADRWPKHELYEKLYCGRANIENEIKQQQMCLFSDRLSSSVMVANQLRMYVSALAGELLETLRRVGLKQTPMEKARADTTRSRLVKQAATVKVSVRRVVVSMASPSPHQGVFRRAHANLRRHFAMLTRWRQRAAPT